MGKLGYIYHGGAFVLKGLLSKSTRQFYDRCAKNYDASNPMQKRYAEELMDQMPYSEIGLDIACGTGISTLELGTKCGKVHALDFSSNMLSLARKNILLHQYSFVKGNFLELPFEDNSIDTACVIGAIRHIPQNKEKMFFSELSRVTGPGGIAGMVVTDYNPIFRPGASAYNCFMKFRGLDECICKYNSKYVCNLLSSSGFEVIRKELLLETIDDFLSFPNLIIAQKPESYK
ncbi:MAG: methyltransferase domain-containing protein [Candidatus Woesearchaeota archaeon]